MTIESLKALRQRIREATGADRALDWAIAYYLAGVGNEKERHLFAEMGSECFTEKDQHGLTPYDKARGDYMKFITKRADRNPWKKGPQYQRIMICDGPSPLRSSPHYTTDPDGLGACVALMREVLPGAIREVEATGKLPKVTVWRYHDIVWQARSTEEHAIESHATLLAIISAKISKLEAEQERIER